MQRTCACGCGQEFTVNPNHPSDKRKYIWGHHLKAAHAGAKSHFAATRPEPLLCACGCGQYTTVYGRKQRRYIKGHSPGRSGSEASQWKGGRQTTSAGYILVHNPGHHLADKRGYVREHRLVWEQANGRRLEPWEDVHHINGVKDDNRPENLVAISKSQHGRLHIAEAQPNQRMTTEQRRAAGRKGAEARWGKRS